MKKLLSTVALCAMSTSAIAGAMPAGPFGYITGFDVWYENIHTGTYSTTSGDIHSYDEFYEPDLFSFNISAFKPLANNWSMIYTLNSGYYSDRLTIDPSVNVKFDKYINISTDSKGYGWSMNAYVSTTIGGKRNYSSCKSSGTVGTTDLTLDHICHAPGSSMTFEAFKKAEYDAVPWIADPAFGVTATFKF